MILALDTLDTTVQGILFLIALVLFIGAAFTYAVPAIKVNLIALGLAFVTFVWMWNAFAAS